MSKMIKKTIKVLSLLIPAIILLTYLSWSIKTAIHDASESTYCGTILSKDRSYRSTYFELGIKWDVGHVNTYPVGSITYNTKSVGERICVIEEWGRIYPEGRNGFRGMSYVLGITISFMGSIFGIIYLIVAMYRKIWED